MNVNFSAWSIHRPTPAILLFVLATVAGFFGFRSLQIANMPDFDFPGIIVDVQLPGATPSQLETEVTRKIEDATANIPGARHVTSTVSDGFSETFIEFEIGKNGNVEDRWLLNDGHVDHHGSAELRIKVSLSGITDEMYDDYVADVLDKLTEQLETRFGIVADSNTNRKARRREHPQTYVNRTNQAALR